jgi:hypothetical protein
LSKAVENAAGSDKLLTFSVFSLVAKKYRIPTENWDNPEHPVGKFYAFFTSVADNSKLDLNKVKLL